MAAETTGWGCALLERPDAYILTTGVGEMVTLVVEAVEGGEAVEGVEAADVTTGLPVVKRF